MKPLARELRSNQTKPELLIWHKIRNKQILNVTFNRQKPILNYILDFYCDKAKLAIEIDGAQHAEMNLKEKDQLRDRILLVSYNIATIRFSNNEVMSSLNAVLDKIYWVTKSRLENPPPHSSRRL